MLSFKVWLVICSKVISKFSSARTFSPVECWTFKKALENCYIIGYLVLGCIMTSRFMFCCQILGRKYQFFNWGAKDLAQELSSWQSYRDTGYLISFFNHLLSFLSKAISQHFYIKEKIGLMCETYFFALQSSAWVWKKLPLVIMSRVILDFWGNIKLDKYKDSPWKILLKHSCLKLLLHPKFQNTYFCFWEIQSSNICTEMGNRMMIGTTVQGLHCKRSTQMMFNFFSLPKFTFSLHQFRV